MEIPKRGKMRSIGHPELKGIWTSEGKMQFTGQEEEQVFGHEMFALPYGWVTQIKIISATNPYSGKDPQFGLFNVLNGGTKVSLEAVGS